MSQVVTGILIGAVVAAVGALVNYLLGLRRDRQRWNREDERQLERWYREDQQRQETWVRENEYRDYQERRAAYIEFVAICDRIFAGNHNNEEAYAYAVNEYHKCEAALRLIAPPVVWRKAYHLAYVSRGRRTGMAEYNGARAELFMAAREDLGKPPRVYPEPPGKMDDDPQ